MRTIGFRAEPSAVTFAVYHQETNGILNVEVIRLPNAMTVPEQLKYLRSNVLDVLRSYEVQHAGLRVTEPFARRANLARVAVEAVIQEAFASSSLKSYYLGHIAIIARRIGVEKTLIKRIVSGEDAYDEVENWGDLSATEREAVLAAIGATRD